MVGIVRYAVFDKYEEELHKTISQLMCTEIQTDKQAKVG